MQLVFADDGRLVERRTVDADGRVRWRITLAADGTVALIDGDGREVAAAKWPRQSVEAPNLMPDTRDLVVLPMPARASQHVASSSEYRIDLTFADVDVTHVPEADVMKLLAGFVAERNADRVRQLIGQRFFERGDRRLGLYTLLLASGNEHLAGQSPPIGNGRTARFEALADHPSSPLAQYIDQHVRQRSSGVPVAGFQPVAGVGFVRRLSEFRSLLAEWTSGRTGHEPAADVTAAVGRVLSLADALPNRMARELLHVVNAKVASPTDVQRIANALERFEADPALAIDRGGDRINLTELRAEFERLLETYRTRAERGFEQANEKAIVAERVRIAVDQWRRIDGESASACATAARVLHKLNESAAAWS